MKTFTFTLIGEIKVLAYVVDNRVSSVELLKGKKIPQWSYNRYLNQANNEALKMWDFVLSVVEYTHCGNPKIIETQDFIDGVLYAYKYNEYLKDQLSQIEL